MVEEIMDRIDILEEAKKVFDIEIAGLEEVRNNLNGDFEKIVKLILDCKGRVIVTGMGKSGHVGRKIAATMSSLGTTAYFLHPAEGLHGDLGGVKRDDIVIAFSKSGETEEIIELIPSIDKIGAKLIAVTCKENSTISQNSDLEIFLKITREASNYNLAPTTSTTAMLVFGDALAVILEKINDFRPEDFAVFHPSGNLGKRLLLKVESLMASGNDNPVVYKDTNLKDIIIEISSKGFGGTSVIDEDGILIGLITDGDLRRMIENAGNKDIFNLTSKDFMICNPITINKECKAIDALAIMENRRKPLSILPVIDNQNKVVGMVRLHDIIRSGVI